MGQFDNAGLTFKDITTLLKNAINRPYDTTWVNNPVRTVLYSNDSLRGIMKQASLLRDNVVIAMGSSEVFAIVLFTKLNFVRDSLNIKVIGLPDWQNYYNLDVDYSQAFKLRVSSENFVDYNSPAAKRFEYQFNKTFNKVLFPLLDNINKLFIRANITSYNEEFELTKYPNYSDNESADEHAGIFIWDALKVDLDLTITDDCLKNIRF